MCRCCGTATINIYATVCVSLYCCCGTAVLQIHATLCVCDCTGVVKIYITVCVTLCRSCAESWLMLRQELVRTVASRQMQLVGLPHNVNRVRIVAREVSHSSYQRSCGSV